MSARFGGHEEDEAIEGRRVTMHSILNEGDPAKIPTEVCDVEKTTISLARCVTD